MRRILVVLIKGYQLLISPVLPPSCRFEPTCSNYAIEAVQRHGIIKGSWLALRRLGRCHPFSAGGYDPVPGHCCHDTTNADARSHCHEHSLSSPVEDDRAGSDKEPSKPSEHRSHPSN